MTLEEKYELTNQVLKELAITAKQNYTRDTIMTVAVVKNLVELTIERIENNNNLQTLNSNPDELPES